MRTFKEIKSQNPNVVYHAVYAVMVAIFAVMIIYLAARCEQPSISDELFASAEGFSYGWRTSDGSEALLTKLHKTDGIKPYEENVIFHTLPDTIENDTSFYFRSKNIYFSVYIGGVKVYEPLPLESSIYTKSFGTRWNCIPISESDAGKDIEIHFSIVYGNSRASIDNVYLGSSGGLVLHTIKGRLVAFITCVLLLFVGLLLVVADIPVNMQARKNHELSYLGLFAVSISLWCLSETNLIQFYFNDSRMMQVVSCASLMLIPIPMILYLNSAFGFRLKHIVPVFTAVSAAEFSICWLLHFLKIADIHETLTLTHIVLAMCAVVMLYTIIRHTFAKGKNATMNIYRILRGIGLSCLSVATIIDIIRYYKGSNDDGAMFVRIGLLIFIICYGSSSLENTINAVKLGVQTEFVSRLAYHDGLTGIGNRTAFEEHLVELEAKKTELDAVGIVMFDVNDLKYVNDNLGHHYGDDMLITSAEIIRNAFESCGGECFRIGGDEFAVLLSGEKVKARCEEGTEKFEEGMKKHNDLPEKEFRISIAHGFAVYNKNSASRKLMDIYQQADMKMYENKKYMKAHQSRPEEYYKDVAVSKSGSELKIS